MPALDPERVRTRAELAALLDVYGAQLYPLLRPHGAVLAAGVASALFSAAERLREHPMYDNEGQDAVDINLLVDARLRDMSASIYLQAHRDEPALRLNSPPLQRGGLHTLLQALRRAEQGQDDEVASVLAALDTEFEAWLQDAARQALASARPDEARLWGAREPLLVAGELLVLGLRRLLREIGGG